MVNIEAQGLGLVFPRRYRQPKRLDRRALSENPGSEGRHSGPRVAEEAVLKNLSFKLSSGDRVGLLGLNGAGKTTLLKVLAGIYTPSSGKLYINGRVTSLTDISLGLVNEVSGVENVYLRGALLGLSRKEIAASISRIEDFADIGEAFYRPVKTYSSGMRLRLAFSVVTVIEPEILIMDEWLSVGDKDFRRRASRKLHDLINQSKILVLASHDRNLLEAHCTRAIWLKEGSVVADGEVSQILEDYFS